MRALRRRALAGAMPAAFATCGFGGCAADGGALLAVHHDGTVAAFERDVGSDAPGPPGGC